MKTAAMALCFAFGAARFAAAAEVVRAPLEVQRSHTESARRPGDPQRSRVCFNSSETREKIVSRRLSEPFQLLRGAAGQAQGEALRAKLCRWNDDYVYEISVLRHDGHIVYIYLNAVSGQAVAAFGEH